MPAATRVGGRRRCATQLAFAEGDRLSACLHSIRAPAQSLRQRAEAPRQQALKAIPSLEVKDVGASRRAGVLDHGHCRWAIRAMARVLVDAAGAGLPVTHGHDIRFWSATDPAGCHASGNWRGETYLTI